MLDAREGAYKIQTCNTRALRRFFAFAVIALIAVSLASCGGRRINFSSGGLPADSDIAGADKIIAPGADGSNATRVALLLPLSARGKFGRVAKSMKNAAELALFDSGNSDVLLIPKDTGGTPAGARKAASEAIADGAEIILGPLFAGSVTSAGAVSRASRVPVIGFSTTVSVAGNGIYLLSMTPQEEINRIVDYTMKRGKTRFGALIPNGAYGNIVLSALRRALEQRSGTLVAVERYAQNTAGMTEPAAKISRLARGSNPKIDAILLAEGNPLLRSLAPLLPYNNVNTKRVKLIGTGLWNNPAIASEPALHGGWFPGGNPAARRNFERRYREVYGEDPIAISSLAYDAVKLASQLASQAPRGQRFTPERIEDPKGFSGVSGLYRFRSNGTTQHGLSILEVNSNGFRVIDSGRNYFGSGLSF